MVFDRQQLELEEQGQFFSFKPLLHICSAFFTKIPAKRQSSPIDGKLLID